MNNIILILNGVLARLFLENLAKNYHSSNFYKVISQDKSITSQKYPGSFEFFDIDPTSSYRLSKIIEDSNPAYVFIVTDKEDEKNTIYTNIKEANKNIRIITNSNINTTDLGLFHQKDTLEIDSKNIIVNKLMEHMPNTPIIARGIGLEMGEVMEVLVPTGSVFCYRYISSISQKNWKIVGIYRDNNFFISTYSFIIRPNDRLLIIGDPHTLSDVYKQIKSEIGQFPAPFGVDIYLYLDCAISGENDIRADIEDAMFLHKKLKNHKLNIIILNPNNFELNDEIKRLGCDDINVHIDYKEKSLSQRITLDGEKKIGLVVLNPQTFDATKKALYKISSPVLKTGEVALSSCKNSLTILNENLNNRDNIASVMFDICLQLNLGIQIYDFDSDENYKETQHEEYENLSKIFGKEISIIKSSTKNPILHIREDPAPTLQFLQFNQSIVKKNIFAIASMNIEKLSFLIDKNPQIFIPNTL